MEDYVLVTEDRITEINENVKTQWKLCSNSSKTKVSLYFNVMLPSFMVITGTLFLLITLIVFFVFILLKTLNLIEHLC